MKQWLGAIRATTTFQTIAKVSRSFGEPMVGGGGRELLAIRQMGHPLDRS
jgi:hypothetical protein